LAYTASGTTLSWGGGTAQDVSGGGAFTLDDGAGNTVKATVTPGSLPAGDASDSVTTTQPTLSWGGGATTAITGAATQYSTLDAGSGNTILAEITFASIPTTDEDDNIDVVIAKYYLEMRNNSTTNTGMDIQPDGTLVVNATDYENLVTADDDIPNKKYADDLITNLNGLSGTKVYYVADSSGGATTRKLTFTNGILTAET
jgi:hypothetical protein